MASWVSEAQDGAMRPIAEGALMVAPTDCKATGTMTVVPSAADSWASGRALGFVFPEELP